MTEMSLFEKGNSLVSSDLFKQLMQTDDNLSGGSGGGTGLRRISLRGGRFREIVGGNQTNVKSDGFLNVVIVDAANSPWLAWEGVETTYADVFFTRWNGQDWDKPVKAHADNAVPDIDPRLTLDEQGVVHLSWQSFADGQYVTKDRVLVDKQDTSAQSGKPGRESALHGARVQSGIPQLPSFIKEPRRATFFIKDAMGAGTHLASDH